MDVACKITSKVIEQRCNSILADHGMEEQNGFMSKRGCSDGIFLLTQTIMKRREHKKGTWVLFLDLIKAFPSVSRTALPLILTKFGAPPRFGPSILI